MLQLRTGEEEQEEGVRPQFKEARVPPADAKNSERVLPLN